MRILVTPERLEELAGQFWQASDGLMEVGSRCQGALASLDWEVRQRAGVEGEIQAAVRQARALAERAGELARSLQDAARRFAEADRPGLSVSGAVLGAAAPPPFWRLPEGRLGGLPFLPVPRVVLPPAGAVLGGLIGSTVLGAPSDLLERVWNWLHGYGWKTNAELAPPPQAGTEKGKLYRTIMQGFEKSRPVGATPAQAAQEKRTPPSQAPAYGHDVPLKAETDAVHPLKPVDPTAFDRQVGCVQYAIARRPDLKVKDAPIPGAADYIPYYEQKGQVLHLREAGADDLRQVVKPGHALVWPRYHQDLKGTAGWDYGHVAIVEEVYPDHIVVSQAGWPGKPRMELSKEQLQSLYLVL